LAWRRAKFPRNGAKPLDKLNFGPAARAAGLSLPTPGPVAAGLAFVQATGVGCVPGGAMSEDVDTLKAALIEWFDILGTIAVAVGVGLALLCLLVIVARRHATTGRRDAELAESTLAAFYQARDNLTWVRLGATSGREGASRPGRENDRYAQLTSQLDAYYTVIERLRAQSEFWSRFMASRYRFQALFGETSTKPFREMRQVRDDVIGAAQKLLEIYGRPMPDKAAQGFREQVQKLESIIWRSSKEDPLEARITSAVGTMEEFCRPVIAGHRTRSRRRSPGYRAHRRHAFR
jgi:hypothetical protein